MSDRRDVPTGPLSGKLALVIGAGGGIGRASASALAHQGATLALATRRGPDDAADGDLLAALPAGDHSLHTVDIGDTATVAALIARIAERHGRLDILVNAAGFTTPVPHADLDALDDALIDRLFAINWRGQFAAVRAAAPMLRASGSGLIVLLSSIAGQTGVGSSIAYCAAKAGIDVLVKSLARVLAPEVRVLAVAPGVVDTSFVAGRTAETSARIADGIPLRRIATADDVAAAVVACAVSLPYSTGNVVVVDGGRGL